ncbi:MAG: NAD-dependent epimerase/dehydratase family protein, partial [Chitinophagaceae bacterium]
MKILLTGANGLLGSCLVKELTDHGHDIIATGKGLSRISAFYGPGKMNYYTLDITNADQVEEIMDKTRPDIIIHAAALTQPD